MIIGTMINQEIQIRDKDKILLTEIKNNSNIGLYLCWFLIIFAKLGLTKLSVILNIMSVLGCWISVFYSKQCIMNKWYITILKQIYIYLVILLVFLMIDFIISVLINHEFLLFSPEIDNNEKRYNRFISIIAILRIISISNLIYLLKKFLNS